MKTAFHPIRPTPWAAALGIALALFSCQSKSARQEEMAMAPGSVASEAKEKARAGGAQKTWKRSQEVAHTSKLMVGDQEELPIQGMEVFARVDGFRARVLVDFYFLNDRNRQLEGTFKVRLPEGATPYFLAFGQSKEETPGLTPEAKPELGGEDEGDPKAISEAEPDAEPMGASKAQPEAPERPGELTPEQIMRARQASWIDPKEARMVPRKKARRAYEDTVRQRVDPAIMEWGGAGVFHARIFPLAPKKLHRVVIGYDLNLTRIEGGLELGLALPEEIPSTSVRLDVSQLEGATIKVPGADEGFEDAGRRYYRMADPEGGQVRVRLEDAPTHALRGGAGDAGEFFAARFIPELEAAPTEGGSRDAILLLDTSLSSNPDRFNVWLAMTEALLTQNRDQIERFAVMFFDVEQRWWKKEFVANTPENVDALLEHAHGLSLEGATDLGAALDAAAEMRGWTMGGEFAPMDVFVLGDGAATWGESDAFAIARRARDGSIRSLFAYRTGMSGGDDQMLASVTRELSGAVFSVVGESQVEAAARAHRARPWRIEAARLGEAEDLLLAGRPQVVFPGQQLVLAGRGAPKAGDVIELDLKRGEETRTVQTELGQVLETPLAGRAYGQLAVGQLEEFLGVTRPFAEAYARHFRVTGKSTSLLMLETQADYESYGIVPQEDAQTIRERPARQIVLQALDELAARLGDARAAFLDRLAALTDEPGVELKLPEGLNQKIAALPRAAFEVQADPLTCEPTGREDVPEPVLNQLREQEPEYDTLQAEAKRRQKAHGPDAALCALSSLVEANPGDSVMARDVGFGAMDLGLDGHAYHLLDRVARARPHEPQTWRAMALALAEQGYVDLALAHFEIGLGGQWNARFGEFRKILLQDYVLFLREQTEELSPALRDFAKARQPQVEEMLGIDEADLVVTIMWNTDRTDVDLHVLEPQRWFSREECYYGHRRTSNGGRLTQDVTQGYGPEMYVIADGPEGAYDVRVKYFSSDRNRMSTRTKVRAMIIRDWGRPTESITREVVSLEDDKQMHDIAHIELEK